MKNLDLRYGEIPTAEQFITRQRVLQSETAIYVRESLSPCLQASIVVGEVGPPFIIWSRVPLKAMPTEPEF